MAEVKARDAKLIQYLNEAHMKERQLEQALEAHIAMTENASYRKRLRQHLSETKNHARQVERRIKQLGGEEGIGAVVQGAAGRVQEVAARGAALAQGQVHMLRGTGPQEKMLKNAKTEFQNEAEEIGIYTSLETLAKMVGDRETEQLAKAILREEKRMAGFLEKLIPRLTQAVARAEIPAAERNGGRGTTRRRSTRRRSGSAARSTSARRGASPSSRSTRRASTSRSRTTSRTSRSAAGSRSRARSGSSSRSRTTSRSGTSRRTTARGGTSARSRSARASSGSRSSGARSK